MLEATSSWIPGTLYRPKQSAQTALEPANPSVDVALSEKIRALGLRHLGVEGERISLNRYKHLRKALPCKIRMIPLTGLIESLRMIKSVEEIEEIRRTVGLTTRAFDAIIPAIKPGIREQDLAAELEYQLRKRGARKTSFDTIVASGPRSALPHGIASNKGIKNNEFVVIDFGVYGDAYASDVTRTIFIGNPTPDQRRVYQAVLEAILEAEETTRPRLMGATLDRSARNRIMKSGFGAYFGHGTGHGIGLEVHEPHFIHPMQKLRIRENMVFTIEPGIYLPDKGGSELRISCGRLSPDVRF